MNDRHPSRRACGLGAAVLAIAFFAATTAGAAEARAARPTPRTFSAGACAALKSSFQMPGVRVAEATVATSGPRGSTVAAYCRVRGIADERTGVDNLPYGIKFQVLAPLGKAWNHKFIFLGGGGSNGSVGDGFAAAGIGSALTPLARGYAVLTQDGGHDNKADNIPTRGGARTFNLDFRARQDMGFRSYGRAAGVAKAVIRAAYGLDPQHSYFDGCSEGGREALLVSQRYPQQFDGVIAGAPSLPAPMSAMVRPAHILQSYATLAREQGQVDRNGQPFINKAFSAADEAVLTKGITDACDKLDGVVDGMSQDFRACTAAFDPATLQCQAGKTTQCLTADQVKALKTQMAGIPGDVRWNWDVGFVKGQLLSWIGAPDAPQASSFWTGGAYVMSYMTPVPVVDLTVENGAETFRSMLKFDLANDMRAVYATSATHPQSAWDLMYASNPDISDFTKRGGKVVMYQGLSDKSFSIEATIAYLNQVDALSDGHAADFMRLFPVPGMYHCSGGPATSDFDALTVLENWVEKGIAPATIAAKAPADTPWPGRTRPLCAFPGVARYKGAGSIEDAANFTCQRG